VLPILLAGCTISINSQKPVVIRDTVYVEKYWGGDVKLPDSSLLRKIIESNKSEIEVPRRFPSYSIEPFGYAKVPDYPTIRNNLPEDTIGITRSFGIPPFEDYYTHMYFDTIDSTIYMYNYYNEYTCKKWRYR
jgi:hypothetical protein